MWSAFERASTQLDRWIDEQNPGLNTPDERVLLQKINTIYDEYFAAARQLQTNQQAAMMSGAQFSQKHGGALQYQTQANHGTTFSIVLPQASRTTT